VPWSCATADTTPCYACTLADPALALPRLQESSRARCPDSQPLRLLELLRTTTGLQRVDPWSPAARGASAATTSVSSASTLPPEGTATARRRLLSPF